MTRLSVLIAALSALAAGAASAKTQQEGERCIDLAALERGGQVIDFSGKKPNRYSVRNARLVIESADSVSILGGEIAPVAPEMTTLSWRWRVSGPTMETDLATKGADDRFLALYVGFAFDSAEASTAETLRRAVLSPFVEGDPPGRIISYTWGGRVDQQRTFESPYEGRSHVVVTLHSGAETNRSYAERVSPGQDYERIFGAPAPLITHIAFAADSDDTDSAFTSTLWDLCFASARGE